MTKDFIDGVAYDGSKPNAYIDSLKISLKGKDQVKARSRLRRPLAPVNRAMTIGGSKCLSNSQTFFSKTGLHLVRPLMRLRSGRSLASNCGDHAQIGVPRNCLCPFLGIWNALASGVQTSLGEIPGQSRFIWRPAGSWKTSSGTGKAQCLLRATGQAQCRGTGRGNPQADVSVRNWTGKPTYLDQIFTSLYTVFTGFAIGTLVAIPLGILCGLSRTFQIALNPLIQIFRPVSPLAWLPIVTIVVSAVYASADPMFQKSFHRLRHHGHAVLPRPTLINTAVGVASIDKDLMNVSRCFAFQPGRR